MKQNNERKTTDTKAKKPLENMENKQENVFYPDISNTASAGECTGVMCTPPQNEDEAEAYKELSGMQIPKRDDETP